LEPAIDRRPFGIKHPRMPTNLVDALTKIPMLSSLDRHHLERLAKDFSKRTFPAGSVIIRQGDTHGIGFFVIVGGEAVVTIDNKEVSRLAAGDHFGAIALIADRVRTATVTASTELETYVMTLWDFRSFVRGDADVAWSLLEQLAAMLQRTSSAATH
jgi:CRP-like cAMP-binding protein